jgi:hypothetical protein
MMSSAANGLDIQAAMDDLSLGHEHWSSAAETNNREGSKPSAKALGKRKVVDDGPSER